MDIIIAGLHNIKTERTLINAQAAISDFDEALRVEWIDNVHQMKEIGAIYTPSVIVNNKLKATGRIPSVFEFTTWVENELKNKCQATVDAKP